MRLIVALVAFAVSTVPFVAALASKWEAGTFSRVTYTDAGSNGEYGVIEREYRRLPDGGDLLIEETKKVRCRPVSIKMDCNTCTKTMCTDGKKQWSSGMETCTLLACPPPQYPFDPKLWGRDGGVP